MRGKFEEWDLDKDGKITYEEFYKTAEKNLLKEGILIPGKVDVPQYDKQASRIELLSQRTDA